MPRQGGPLENDEDLGRVRQLVMDGVDVDEPAIALGLLYVGDCIRIAVDQLIVTRTPLASWKECGREVTRDGHYVGTCALPTGHEGGACKCYHQLMRGE